MRIPCGDDAHRAHTADYVQSKRETLKGARTHARRRTHARTHAHTHTHTDTGTHKPWLRDTRGLAPSLVFSPKSRLPLRLFVCVHVCVICSLLPVHVSARTYNSNDERGHSRRVLFLSVTCPMDARAVKTTRVAAAPSDKTAT